MKLHADSHVDHGLSPAQVAYLLERFADRAAFFIETIELPPELGDVPCALHGPLMGDPPIDEAAVHYQVRGERTWTSRCLRPGRVADRRVRTVSVIAGPHDGEPCVLFTTYGGPVAPQEPDDPKCKDVAASRAFWQQHALVVIPPPAAP